jgi:hypothetical protein
MYLTDPIMEHRDGDGDGDGDGDKPLTLNRSSEKSHNKLMKSPSFTEAEKRLMTRIRNTNMAPRMKAVLLSRSGIARKLANMLGINKSVVQTPKARMRIANNIYTRVNAKKKKIIVKPITELSQKDLDASTSLFMVRVDQPGYVRDPRDIKISWKDQWGKDFSKTARLNIEWQFDYQMGDRRLESIVKREAGGFVTYGCIYFVLNAESIDEAAQHIEIYANTMGGIRDYGLILPNFCRQMDLAKLAREYSRGGPPVPSHQDMEGDRRSGKRGGGTMNVRVKSTPTRTGGRSRKRRVRTQRAHRKRT